MIGKRFGLGLIVAGVVAGNARAGDLVFEDCLAGLRAKAANTGVTGDSFDQSTQGLAADFSVLELLDAQPEFTTPICDYLAALVDEQRL